MDVLQTNTADYIGADLTDRYARKPKPVDVCGLSPASGQEFTASFWKWTWMAPVAARPVDGSKVAAEIKQSRCAMLDAPQALATVGSRMRCCERRAGAAGKTPDTVPARGPFAGYIRSSVELFSAIFSLGIPVLSSTQPPQSGSVGEVYPGYGWRVLAGRQLKKKSSAEGKAARRKLLEILGVRFPHGCQLTHDHLDACLAALTAAASDNAVRGASVNYLGDPLSRDATRVWREGMIAVLQLNDRDIIDHRDAYFGDNPSLLPHVATRDEVRRRAAERTRIRVSVTEESQLPDISQTEAESRAEELLEWCILNLEQNVPVTLTYRAAHVLLSGLHTPFPKYAQAHGQMAIRVAETTSRQELPNLGSGGLDCFIVAEKTRQPGDGHWKSADYEREDWERVFHDADLLHIVKDRLVRMSFA